MPTRIDATKITDYMYIGSAPKRDDPLHLVCDIVVLTAVEYQPTRDYWEYVDIVRAPIDDAVPMDAFDMRTAKVTAGFLAEKVKEGNVVLSTCAMGVNRSSLISALTIMDLHPEMKPQEVIDLIRVTRGVDLAELGVDMLPLCNTSFQKFIKKQRN